MVIIFQKGNEFWIESIIIDRINVVGGGETNFDRNLQRAGTFLCCSVAIDAGTMNSTRMAGLASHIKQTDDSELVAGDEISAIRIRQGNDDAGGLTFGTKVMVFMRGTHVRV